MSTTEAVSNESGKDIDQKMPTMDTVPMGMAQEFDNEAEAIAVFTDHAGEPARWGKGIIRDFKQTVGTNWVKEMTNFNQKTVAVTLFIYIAAIAPTITFGAVYGRSTNNYMGAIELMLATGWYGTVYALIGGMPMVRINLFILHRVNPTFSLTFQFPFVPLPQCINGGTGPVLTFQTICYQLADSFGVPFLTFNAWVGIWVAVYMVIAAFVDLNRILKYATRFTDEVFAFLIISIFILDAIGDFSSGVGILPYFNPNGKYNTKMFALDPDYNYMEVALLSLVLGFGTAFFALALRSFRHSPFFCNDMVRTSICDFAITLSVIIFTCIAQFAFGEVPLEELNVPAKFEPTFTCCTSDCTSYWPTECPEQEEPWGKRPWLVDLFNLNGKGFIPILCAGPACLAFVLVWLDNGITWHIVNHPSNKLTHGEAYNYDTCLSAAQVLINGIIGCPWLVASTVPCVLHVTAMSNKTKDGNTINVQESRLTGFFVHVLIFATIFALNLLKILPLAVLYGVFLFMGLVALPAQQFWQRILLFFMQPARYPDYPYVKYMPKKRVHLYTFVELCFFGLVFTVREIKTIAIAFPLMTLLCIPARVYLLPCIFAQWELLLVDGDPNDIALWCQRKENFMEGEHAADAGDAEMAAFVKDEVSLADSEYEIEA